MVGVFFENSPAAQTLKLETDDDDKQDGQQSTSHTDSPCRGYDEERIGKTAKRVKGKTNPRNPSHREGLE